MKIIFVTQKFPYPLDSGGNIRSYHILRQLAKEHSLTLISNLPADTPPPPMQEIEQLCAKVITVPEKSDRIRLGWAVARSLVGTAPYFIYKNYSAGVQRALVSELKEGGYQAVHFNHLDAASYHSCLPEGVLRILDTHNILTLVFERFYQQARNPLLRSLYRLQWRKTRKLEERFFRAMDLCLTCSLADATLLKQMIPDICSLVVPNGVDTRAVTPLAAGGEKPELLFIGTMDYPPNSDGVVGFCREALPLIRAKLPDIVLSIIGRHPSAALRQLARQDENIRLLGAVEDVWGMVHVGHILVVPLLVGGGTRLKILDAMARGLPVVSTRVGAEGITARNGREIFLSDDIRGMAEGVITLCEDARFREKISRNARQLTEQNYDWEIIGRNLRAAYNRLGTSP